MTIAKSLLSLQDTDQALALRRRDYRAVEKELKSEGGLPELRDNCEKTRLRELEAKVETARLESDLATLKEQVSELETRLYGGSITNVRELTAIETEHSAVRRSLAQVEESIAPAEVAAEHARQQFEDLTKELAEKEDATDSFLRMGVRPGGCNGFSYDMYFDSKISEDDVVEDYEGIKIVVDSESLQLYKVQH